MNPTDKDRPDLFVKKIYNLVEPDNYIKYYTAQKYQSKILQSTALPFLISRLTFLPRKIP